MKVIRLDDAARDRVLAERRLGVLSTLRRSGLPVAVPVWYGWDGHALEMFSARHTPKMRRLAADPRATLLVHNFVDEPPRWVAFEGRIAVSDDGTAAAERLTRRYLGELDTPAAGAALALFREYDLVRLVLAPSRVTTYAEVY
jgi:PPOX class probable F420-dependent enzyme